MKNIIKDTLDSFPAGFVFTPADIPVEIGKQPSVNRTLNNMVAAGKIRRLSKGRFYKPEISQFGELQPNTYQIVKDLIEKNGKTIGYITGYSAFNDLGLTTQVPFALQIGTTNEKKAIQRGIYKISFIKQKNPITKKNILLLRLLDCLRFFKKIPDTAPDNSCRRLLHLLRQLDATQITQIKRLALKYNPAAIALLGAMLESIDKNQDTSMLLNMLNPQTFYTLGISETILPNQQKWYIK